MQIKNISEDKYLWLPINLWNLNELFTTESISPISFYSERNFGNPINRNQEKIEDVNNLVLFQESVQSSILLKISISLLDINYLSEIKSSSKSTLRSFEYSKTIYLKNGEFNVCFSSDEKLNEFLNSAFMLLEVKTTNKYKAELGIIDIMSEKKAIYQTRLISDRATFQPFFDKAINQIKGLIYGYLIGSIGTLSEKEQSLITNLSKLKNIIGTVHTDIALSEQHSESWLINLRKQITDCQKSYFENFNEQSEVLDTLLLRLEEINNLNKMRCVELSNQKSLNYKKDFEKEQTALENMKQKLYRYEDQNKIIYAKEELEQIKQDERRNGEMKGKIREYYKIGTKEYDRKQKLKQQISKFEENEEYKILKKEVDFHEERLRSYQFGFTQFDTSISEQFSRISEYLYEITKNTSSYFLSKNNKTNNFPDISFEIDLLRLANFYFDNSKGCTDFSIQFPAALSKMLNESELQLLKIVLNSILSNPQGQLGNFSEQNILQIIKEIGEQLPENSFKQLLRNYYMYRIGKIDSFTFPENFVMANIITFFMKHNGHDQINKMIISKNIHHRQISFLLYGAYLGFANMPKTFTNIIFDSENSELISYIDQYLFTNFINQK